MCGVVASMAVLPPLPILATNIASRARGADSVGTFYHTRTLVRGYTVRRRHVPGGPGGRPARTAQRLRREVGDGGVLTPGPVAMDLLTQVQNHRLDDVERTEY